MRAALRRALSLHCAKTQPAPVTRQRPLPLSGFSGTFPGERATFSQSPSRWRCSLYLAQPQRGAWAERSGPRGPAGVQCPALRPQGKATPGRGRSRGSRDLAAGLPLRTRACGAPCTASPADGKLPEGRRRPLGGACVCVHDFLDGRRGYKLGLEPASRSPVPAKRERAPGTPRAPPRLRQRR